MKTPSLVNALVFASALGAMISSAPAHAQNLSPIVSVTVPFGFELGSQHFATVAYTISHPGEHVIIVGNRSKAGMTLTRWEDSKHPTDKGKVVFHRYGEQYFLREVWPSTGTTHLECSESKQERQVRRAEVAASAPAAKDAELALGRNPHLQP